MNFCNFNLSTEMETKSQPNNQCSGDENADDLSAKSTKSISWWRYLLPFHYFV